MKKRILVVDDNQAILDVVKMALELVGYEVLTSLTSACFKHMDGCTLPDLVLLDILLSGEDGAEICQRLKSDDRTRHIPVILLSAHTGLHETAEKCGANGFLMKPFRLAELREIVSKYLTQSSPTLI
jgi:CheY-like chemotaxis protein